MPELLKTKGGFDMKKTTCFVLGSLVGGGIAGFTGLCVGMFMPFVAADNSDNHCIYWRKVKNGYTEESIYGNRSLFPELTKEETSE